MEAWQSLLTNTDVMTEDGVTVGGMLLFGATPNRFLPHAGIDAVAYPGTEQDYAAERAAIRGPMTPLLSRGGEFVENGLTEQALDFVHRNTRMAVEARGGRRVERPVYPRDALLAREHRQRPDSPRPPAYRHRYRTGGLWQPAGN